MCIRDRYIREASAAGEPRARRRAERVGTTTECAVSLFTDDENDRRKCATTRLPLWSATTAPACARPGSPEMTRRAPSFPPSSAVRVIRCVKPSPLAVQRPSPSRRVVEIGTAVYLRPHSTTPTSLWGSSRGCRCRCRCRGMRPLPARSRPFPSMLISFRLSLPFPKFQTYKHRCLPPPTRG